MVWTLSDNVSIPLVDSIKLHSSAQTDFISKQIVQAKLCWHEHTIYLICTSKHDLQKDGCQFIPASPQEQLKQRYLPIGLANYYCVYSLEYFATSQMRSAFILKIGVSMGKRRFIVFAAQSNFGYKQSVASSFIEHIVNICVTVSVCDPPEKWAKNFASSFSSDQNMCTTYTPLIFVHGYGPSGTTLPSIPNLYVFVYSLYNKRAAHSTSAKV